ncbi:hypothetical protein Tco_1071455 [Tanacetum coccineum]
MGCDENIPTGKDNFIVSTGRPNMVPAGRTIVSPGSIIFGPAQQLKPKLYVGDIIIQTNPIVIPDSEETLALIEESQPTLSIRPTNVEVPKELPKVSMVNTSVESDYDSKDMEEEVEYMTDDEVVIKLAEDKEEFNMTFCDPDKRMSIGLEEFVDIDNMWDDLDLGIMFNEKASTEFLKSDGRIQLHSPDNLQLSFKIRIHKLGGNYRDQLDSYSFGNLAEFAVVTA